MRGRSSAIEKSAHGVIQDAPSGKQPDRRRTHAGPRLVAYVPLVPSGWWVADVSALSFLIVTSAALLIQLLVYRSNAFGTVVTSGLVAALVVFHITNGVRNRRKATARRLHAIGELNHHIRNGLQQIVAATALPGNGGYKEIQSAIDRIEWILRDCTTEIRSDD